MEDIPITRAYLESLTTQDLIKMADNFGVDMPPDLDRVFIIGELLEITSPPENDDGSFPGSNAEESDLEDSVLTESVPLPRQYNITFIEVMIRDPLWAFVFWEIKAADKDQFENDPEFVGYFLKVSPWIRAATDNVFSVSVGPNDTAWYLGLAPFAAQASSAGQMKYKVELCVSMGETETVLAVSKPVTLPGLPELPGRQEKQESSGAWDNPLVRLSGYGDFRIIRRNERQPRTKNAVLAESHE